MTNSENLRKLMEHPQLKARLELAEKHRAQLITAIKTLEEKGGLCRPHQTELRLLRTGIEAEIFTMEEENDT